MPRVFIAPGGVVNLKNGNPEEMSQREGVKGEYLPTDLL
jgi:hypothetical protein